jgi:hypothetical protein
MSDLLALADEADRISKRLHEIEAEVTPLFVKTTAGDDAPEYLYSAGARASWAARLLRAHAKGGGR